MVARTSTPTEDAALSLTLAVVASSKSPVVLLDGEFKIVAASRSFGHAFQIDPATALGRPLFELGDGEWNAPQLRSLLTATIDGVADIDSYEMDLVRKGQKTRQLVVHAERLVYLDLEHLRLLLAVADVTESRAIDKQAADMRRENALLLKEVRHRVANSLQIIASVLLQDARRTQSEEARGHLHSAHHRVMSVAALERQLAASEEDVVKLRPYLIKLCDSIGASMIHDPKLVSLKVIAEDVEVDPKVSVSLGLIVTELVINALKHAFPDRRPGHIEVGYATMGEGWTLRIRDDGVGMPPETDKAAGGLGTSIIQALAEQLDAAVVVGDGRPGAAISVIHPAVVDRTQAERASPVAV